jgi:CRISPR/Cas system-associated exonuclease Cas4 (RecB family)
LEQLSATDIASFVRLQLCRRYLAFRAGRGKEKVEEVQRRFRILADPAYQEVGLRSEETVRNLLEQHGFQPAQGLLEESTWPRWLEEVGKADPGRALYAREVEISGQVGVFSLEGRIDFVLLLWKDGAPKVRVLELKASRRNRSHHYVQLALYASLVKANPPIWQGQPVEVDYLVVRVDPGTMAPEDPRRPPTREEKKLLEQAIQDVEDLLKKGGLVEEILSEPDPFRIPYTLNARCDACGYNTVCLRKAAERRDLELLSLPGDVVRGLREAGFRDLQDLAGAQPGDARWDEALKRMENPLPPAHLVKRAQARLAPLEPQLTQSKKYYPVQALPDTGFGTLPPHEIKIKDKDKDKPLIRIYLVVEKDLVAERLNALVAHVTSGPEHLPKDSLSLKDHRFVLQVRRKAWSGDPAKDDAAEGRLIRDFFTELVRLLRDILGVLEGKEQERAAPLHFYVWSQADIKNLVEAILRVGPKGGSLLEALWHLMGCREGLEQLIFSSLADEVRTRYALGYTSLSLLTATSLPFFGEPFPWHNLDGVNLKSLFHHWLFDFHHFEDGRYMEVRSRNYDALPPVYWRFFWKREKKFPKNLPPEVRDAVRGAALFIPTYLQARSLALRWLEERVTPKNKLLKKPLLRPEELPNFRLKARGVLRVARDFLRFEQQVRFSLWLADRSEEELRQEPLSGQN